MAQLNSTPLFTDANLKAYYRFESGALTTDESGESHTLTAISDPAEGTGRFGGGVDLDGNDAYSITDHADLKPTGNFSVGAWFKTSTTGVYQLLFQSFSQNTNIAGISLRIQNSNVVGLQLGRNTGTGVGDDKNVSGTSTVTDGNWHLGVATWDGSNIRIYVDGVCETTAAWTYAAGYAATNYVRVGCYNNSGTNQLFLTGSLDEVFLFNGTALSADQINWLYKTSSGFFDFF